MIRSSGGEWVLAIGSPFVRPLPKVSSAPRAGPLIRTTVTAWVLSGGPLFNMKGEVVGINSQIFTRSGGFMGLSFAIPIDVAIDVSNQLKKDGKVSRGWLGVVIQEVNKDLAESFGLDKPAGALVAQVLENGPAAKGGLQVGDVILSMNGQPIVMSDLPHLVGGLKDGEKAKLEIIRNGKRQNLDISVGALPDDDVDIGAGTEGSAERSSNRLGVSVADLTAEQKKSLELKGGVVIKEVQDGPAAMIGLRPGDVISHLNNQAIGSAKEFTEIAKELPKNRSVSMRVLRQGRASFITFKLAE
ncbi:serine protease Do [Pseudomonas putida]|nr:serine protease Do [Pseudomonas putida]